MDTPNTSTPATSNPAPAGDLYAALAYLPPLLFILTMIKKGDSPSHVSHAKNGAGLLVVAIAISVLNQILVQVLGLYFLTGLVSAVLGFLMLFAAWQAWNGKQLNIPVVTPFGQKIPLEKWFHKGMMDENASSSVTPTPAPSAPVETAPVAPMPEPMPMAPAPVEAAAAPMASMPEPMPMVSTPAEAAPMPEAPVPMPSTPAPEPSVPPSAPEVPSQNPSA